MSKQVVYEGATVMVQGFEMVATNVEWSEYNGMWCVRFTGTCTDNRINDHVRATGYNGGRYGGYDYDMPTT